MADVFQLLAAGGDVFTIGICVAMYKVDRRLLRLEMKAGFIK